MDFAKNIKRGKFGGLLLLVSLYCLLEAANWTILAEIEKKTFFPKEL